MSLFRDAEVTRTARRPERPDRRRTRSVAPTIESLETRQMLSHVPLYSPARDTTSDKSKAHHDKVELGRVKLDERKPHKDRRASTASPTVAGYTPAEIRAAYGLPALSGLKLDWSGAGQTIAIVVAYNDPNLTADLDQFDAAFGVPGIPSLNVVGENGLGSPLPGVAPVVSGEAIDAWEEETSLDVEWAHAIAPGASIDVVEANSSNISDLDATVATAAALPGVSVVSMSWNTFETPGETSLDSTFTTPAGHQGVTFVAAAGDLGPFPTYPASSPNVLAVGGTTLELNQRALKANKYLYKSESDWSSGGGGLSIYEAMPSYQRGIAGNAGHRITPDVSFDANPATGVAFDDAMGANGTLGQGVGGWTEIGGTSVGAPAWAAIVAIADGMRADSGYSSLDGRSQTLPALYRLPSNDFHRIGDFYNSETGLGSPVANRLIPDLAAYGLPQSSHAKVRSHAVAKTEVAIHHGPASLRPHLEDR